MKKFILILMLLLINTTQVFAFTNPYKSNVVNGTIVLTIGKIVQIIG